MSAHRVGRVRLTRPLTPSVSAIAMRSPFNLGA